MPRPPLHALLPLAASWALAAIGWPAPAAAWGDEGHEIIGHLAAHYLSPAARRAVDALLAEDATGLTPSRSLAAETTWADRYRDSDRGGDARRYRGTREWHYVDIEIAAPDLDAACHGHAPLPAGVPASQGPADACIVDKVDQFRAELADPRTEPEERLRALQFLLHLVGDLHQPLHAADHDDRGGNAVRVHAPDGRSGNLHHAWDTVFVRMLGTDPAAIADQLAAELPADAARRYAEGSPREWALESFAVARTHVYAPLPAATDRDLLELDPTYASTACATVREQLQRAGVRLARVLNEALAASAAPRAAAPAAARQPPPIRPALTLIANPRIEALKKNEMMVWAITMRRMGRPRVETSEVWQAAAMVNEK